MLVLVKVKHKESFGRFQKEDARDIKIHLGQSKSPQHLSISGKEFRLDFIVFGRAHSFLWGCTSISCRIQKSTGIRRVIYMIRKALTGWIRPRNIESLSKSETGQPHTISTISYKHNLSNLCHLWLCHLRPYGFEYPSTMPIKSHWELLWSLRSASDSACHGRGGCRNLRGGMEDRRKSAILRVIIVRPNKGLIWPSPPKWVQVWKGPATLNVWSKCIIMHHAHEYSWRQARFMLLLWSWCSNTASHHFTFSWSQVGVVLKSCSDTVPEGARTGRTWSKLNDCFRWAAGSQTGQQHRTEAWYGMIHFRGEFRLNSVGLWYFLRCWFQNSLPRDGSGSLLGFLGLPNTVKHKWNPKQDSFPPAKVLQWWPSEAWKILKVGQYIWTSGNIGYIITIPFTGESIPFGSWLWITIWLLLWSIPLFFHWVAGKSSQLTNSIIFQRFWLNHRFPEIVVPQSSSILNHSNEFRMVFSMKNQPFAGFPPFDPWIFRLRPRSLAEALGLGWREGPDPGGHLVLSHGTMLISWKIPI